MKVSKVSTMLCCKAVSWKLQILQHCWIAVWKFS